ncbi:MAG TPA: response regulator [Elusimicrobiota bacterium]|nr:response regulator [Elusimicrobiota bacterium]
MERADDENRVLVVDDDARIGQLIEDVLGRDGYRVGCARSGEEAFRAYRENPDQLVLLDMVLPGESGLEILKGLKKINPEARVVVMTGYSVLGMLENASHLGCLAALIKPFTIDDLRQTVVSTTGKKAVEESEHIYSALVIDHEDRYAQLLGKAWRDLDFLVVKYPSIAEARKHDRGMDFDLILVNKDTVQRASEGERKYLDEKTPTVKLLLRLDTGASVENIVKNIETIFPKKTGRKAKNAGRPGRELPGHQK